MTTNQNPPATEQTGTATATDTVLEVSGLTKIYPNGTVAVDDIDFGIKRGDFCVLIGPSGSGKSTTLHALVGTTEPTDGTVLLNGEDITHLPTYQRDIGLVFQHFHLFPHKTVRENVAYGLERSDVRKNTVDERVKEYMELLQLTHISDSSPASLSSGERQRAALARTLVLEPEVVFLDEPLGDLDYRLQRKMERELIRIHNETETTFVYVTHDQRQAMRLGDQIVVLNEGLIEQSASVAEVYGSPATAFVATFVGDSNSFSGTVVGGDDETVEVETDAGTFTATVSDRSIDPESDDGITVAIRPQHVQLDGEEQNSVTGTVTDVIQIPGTGTHVYLNIDGRDESSIEFQVTLPHIVEVETDEELTISWSADHTILLDKQSVVEGIDIETEILGE